MPVTMFSTWTITVGPVAAAPTVVVEWPGARYSDHGDGFNIHFTVTRGGEASWDLGCGLFFAPTSVDVGLATRFVSDAGLIGSGSVSMVGYGTGPILNGVAAQLLLVGQGNREDDVSQPFSAALAQGTYDQFCGTNGDIFGPGGAAPVPGGQPELAKGTGRFTCSLSTTGTFRVPVSGLQAVPEPTVLSSVAIGLLALAGWRARRRA